MGDVAIRVTQVSKRYRLGQFDTSDTLRDFVSKAATSLPRALFSSFNGRSANRTRNRRPGQELIWALKDVSFDIDQGEIVGVIGPNGAGKSTLLKIMSRITEPTEGELQLRGRVSALLDVRVGFHPELSGRENIYLNGSILGMKRSEIKRKLDEIVAFAELERFADTPVKRYSSGMSVRLGFAVAAHLEPEILLVDEVLAVGDAAFQRKCLGKIREVAQGGRTVVFISHSMPSIQSLCTRGIVLQAGHIEFDGDIGSAIEKYSQSSIPKTAIKDLSRVTTRQGTGDIRFTAFTIENERGDSSCAVANGEPCTFVLGYEVSDPSRVFDNLEVGIEVINVAGMRVFYHKNYHTGQPFYDVVGKGSFRFHVPRLTLSRGSYMIVPTMYKDKGQTVIDRIEEQIPIEVFDGDFFGTGSGYSGAPAVAVLVDGSWEHRQV